MSKFRTLNASVVGKLEATPGTDAAPTTSANAFLVENPDFSPVLNTQETNEVTGSLDARAPIPTTGSRQGAFKLYMRGSGAAGTAPRWADVLQACSFGLQTIGTDVTGTAQAGAAGSITLASGASATNDFYVGFVIETTGGTGPNQKRIITAYNGTSKVATVLPAWTVTPDNTTTYAVRKGNKFYLQSAALPNASIYRYQIQSDGSSAKLSKLIGGAGNAKFTIGSQGCFIEFDFKGGLVVDTDPAVPSAPVYDSGAYAPFINGQVYLDSVKAQLNSFTFDPGCEVTLEEDPNAPLGLGLAGITRRKAGGSFRLPKDLTSTRDVVASWRDGVESTLTAIWGQVAGSRFALMSQHMVYTGGKDADVQGFAYDELPFRTNGQDTGFFLTCW